MIIYQDLTSWGLGHASTIGRLNSGARCARLIYKEGGGDMYITIHEIKSAFRKNSQQRKERRKVINIINVDSDHTNAVKTTKESKHKNLKKKTKLAQFS